MKTRPILFSADAGTGDTPDIIAPFLTQDFNTSVCDTFCSYKKIR